MLMLVGKPFLPNDKCILCPIDFIEKEYDNKSDASSKHLGNFFEILKIAFKS